LGVAVLDGGAGKPVLDAVLATAGSGAFFDPQAKLGIFRPVDEQPVNEIAARLHETAVATVNPQWLLRMANASFPRRGPSETAAATNHPGRATQGVPSPVNDRSWFPVPFEPVHATARRTDKV
jgi:hypothetical protein